MPPLSRYFIKSGFICLAAALCAAVISVFRPADLYFTYLHLLVVGWITQIIFGVAYWLFPRVSRERPYGNTAPAVAAFVLLNLGLLLRVVAEPLLGRAEIWGMVLAASAILQWVAVVAYSVYAWGRVRAR